MKSLVGIYQKKEQVSMYLDSIGVKYTAFVEVGPFSSQLQGVEWMEYLGKKTENYEIASFPLEYTDKAPWYGFVFELNGLRDKNYTRA